MYAWSHWLLPALMADPFVRDRLLVITGWETRGRPPSQYSYVPSGIIDHHTACMIRVGHDPQSCINGIVNGREGAPGPISQLLGTFTPPGVRWNGGNADPRIVLIAAGRSNHAGTGIYRWGAPPGNGSSIGIEWCGPPVDKMPDVVVELRERVDAAILRNRGWNADQVDTHYGYARPVGRKIDQSGAWLCEPRLAQLQPWNADLWRSRISTRLNSTGDIDMKIIVPDAPIRVLDTRVVDTPANGGLGSQLGQVTVHAHRANFPAGTVAVMINVAATGTKGPGYLTAWTSGPKPLASFVSYDRAEQTISGFTVVKTSTFGTFELGASGGAADAVVDVAAFIIDEG